MFWHAQVGGLLLFMAGDVEFGIGLQEGAAISPELFVGELASR